MAMICRQVEERFKEIRESISETVETIRKEFQEKVCESLPWPLDWFCKLVTRVIFETIRIVVVVILEVVRVVSRVVCEFVTAVLYVVGAALSTLINVPFLGPIVRGAIRLIMEAWSQGVGLVDAGARLLGIRITKYLRVCIIVLREDSGALTAPAASLATAIALAESTFYRGAKVRLKVLGIHEPRQPAPRDALDVHSEAGAIWEELWLPGGYYEAAATANCTEESFLRLIGLGGPVIAFVVRSIEGGPTGCSLGPLTDYITVERACFVGAGADPTVLAHELAHACSLGHVSDPTNLMFGSSGVGQLRGTALSPLQSTLLRNNRHVTYV
ncbi:hypothetical protein [Lysobacter sp. cf310]|uniref:hypothetical protein n=1 Tax=Lysobacter sp. cf310 TaxID=1761790 RepID=UPI0008E6E2FF|nr:hypothetical protein [Lysobacter sp. cf310]SFK27024.1 hypothetical protein SAMN04487938_0099 [Lysobacter sp. cf310]